MLRRHVLLAIAGMIAGAGCHAGNGGVLKRPEPSMTKETISKARIIAEHNRNAAAVRSLKATASIQVSAEGRQFPVSGRMAMDRPKDFRFVLSSHGSPQADIGSNDKEFWFWLKDNKTLYVCDHDQINASPLAVTMQPDWIMEAMGFREISERDAATISASPGTKPGELVLRQLRKDAKGNTLTKMTIVDESTGAIREHRLYAGAEKDLLARATILEHTPFQVGASTEDSSGTVVSIPTHFKLEWLVEKLALEITIPKPTINPQFAKEQRDELFTEPPIRGSKRQDLALLGGGPSAAAPSSFHYESAPRSGVRLGKPELEPMNVEGGARASRNPQPLSASLPPLPKQRSTYVGPQVPRGTDPDAVRASSTSGWGPASFDR